MGSGERKRCSNIAPVRKLRSFAWIKARRLPGVRCSTLKTECRSLLCLIIMPGRSCVAGMAIDYCLSLVYLRQIAAGRRTGTAKLPVWANFRILYGLVEFVNATTHPQTLDQVRFQSRT